MSVNGHKLGLGVGFGYSGISAEECIELVANAGFDAVFCGWSGDDKLNTVTRAAEANGLEMQSLHAPFHKVDRMWQDGSEGDMVLTELCRCLDACSEHGIGIMVSHVWIGFEKEQPNDTGISRFNALLEYAERAGVRVAFENTEGEGYLEYLRDRLWSHPSAGFCIDTGHELCYNRGNDMISKYGADGKLFATHINDNMGVTGDVITWHDDAHMLPFDGIADWQGVASRLCKVGYDGILSAELTVLPKPGKTTHEIYRELDCAGFAKLAYERVARLAEML